MTIVSKGNDTQVTTSEALIVVITPPKRMLSEAQEKLMEKE